MSSSNQITVSEQVSEDRFVKILEDKFKCPICLECLHIPTQCPQGHVFCHNCIHKVASQNGCKCPLDRKHFSKNQLFPNLFVQNCIDELIVRCKHKSTRIDGTDTCEWIGPLHTADKHENLDCDFRPIKCPNIGCATSTQFRNHQVHVTQECMFRKVTCVYCSLSVYSHAASSHESICDMIPKRCPNECDDEFVIPRHHKSICPLQLLDCPLFELNCCRSSSTVTSANSSCDSSVQTPCVPCTGKVRRRDLFSHVGSTAGLTDTVIMLCEQVKEANKRCENMTKELSAARNLSGIYGSPDTTSSLAPSRDWNTSRPAAIAMRNPAVDSAGNVLDTHYFSRDLPPLFNDNNEYDGFEFSSHPHPSTRRHVPQTTSMLALPTRGDTFNTSSSATSSESTHSNLAPDTRRSILEEERSRIFRRSEGNAFGLSSASRVYPYLHRPPTPPVFAPLSTTSASNGGGGSRRRRTVHDLMREHEEPEGEGGNPTVTEGQQEQERVNVRPRIGESSMMSEGVPHVLSSSSAVNQLDTTQVSNNNRPAHQSPISTVVNTSLTADWENHFNDLDAFEMFDFHSSEDRIQQWVQTESSEDDEPLDIMVDVAAVETVNDATNTIEENLTDPEAMEVAAFAFEGAGW